MEKEQKKVIKDFLAENGDKYLKEKNLDYYLDSYYLNGNEFFTTNVSSEDGKIIKIEAIDLSLLEIF